MRQNVHVSDHPLVTHKLSYLRQPKEIVHFRDYESLIYEMGLLLAYEATKSLDLSPITENRRSNDQAWRSGRHLTKKPVLVPLVRSGLIMADAMRSVIQTPFMGHLGVFDDTSGDQAQTRAFMATMPDEYHQRQVILVDLFIDRGRTANHALRLVRQMGVPPEYTSFVCLIASEEGLSLIHEEPLMNEVTFVCARHDTGEDRWLPSYQRTNERLYRTRNRLPQNRQKDEKDV